MGRPVMLSNSRLLVGLNKNGLVHDFYYPYVGLDNLTTQRNLRHNIGVWTSGKFSWLDDGSWQIEVDFEEDALISNINAKNEYLGIELAFKDFVDPHYNAFCRYITVTNSSADNREIRLFMHQSFQISRGGRGDTALYVPSGNYILDYKGRVSLLIYAQNESGQAFDQFAIGNYGIEGKEGTYKDAEDGILSGNLVEHGGVDSVVRCSSQFEPAQKTAVSYWVVAADSQFDAEIVHRVLLQQGLPKRIDSTRHRWREWLEISADKLQKIDPAYLKQTKKSLLVIKSHADKHGGIIASCDSSIYNYGRDYYSYVWPRDGALTLLPLIALGYTDEAKRFFEFCADTVHPGGYMMHKYQPDRSIGSTWHPLLHRHHPELAIQEDETASVMFAISMYLKKTNDVDYVKSLWSNFIKPASDFMAGFIDKATGLPHASYDLWEEKFATHTYTVVATIAALRSAADMADTFGYTESAESWRHAASEIDSNLMKLYKTDGGYYRKSLFLLDNGNLEYDDTLDVSSAYSFILFNDPRSENQEVASTFSAIEGKLLNSSPSGGSPRYEHDNYFRDKQQYLGNPWLITTLWIGQYYIKNGHQDKAKELLQWTLDRRLPSGMFPEQVDPDDGHQVGVTPLVWSHASFIETVLMMARIV